MRKKPKLTFPVLLDDLWRVEGLRKQVDVAQLAEVASKMLSLLAHKYSKNGVLKLLAVYRKKLPLKLMEVKK